MSVDRNKQVGGYERQLQACQLQGPCLAWLGHDDLVVTPTWPNSRLYFHAEFDQAILRTVGQAPGARGALVEWEIPALVQDSTDWRISDYDQELVDQLMGWQRAGTKLRLFVYGRFWLRCRIGNMSLAGPLKRKLRIQTLNRQLYIYGNSLGSPVWNGTPDQVTYNNPFLSAETYGHLYGTVSE